MPHILHRKKLYELTALLLGAAEYRGNMATINGDV